MKIFYALLAFGLSCSVGQAQLVIDLSVEVTKGTDDVYTYLYTLENSDFSFQGINTFFLDTAMGAEVESIEGPRGWGGFHDPNERLQQAVFITGLSGDGLFCGQTDMFDLNPGATATFEIRSTWAPEPKAYEIAKTIEHPDFGCDFDGESVKGMISSPSLPPIPDPESSCDFDGDGDCDLVDINNLTFNISVGTNNEVYELTGDDMVDLNDLTEFLSLVNRSRGDADLNGTVEFADFLTLSGNFGNDEQVWSNGDFDADGMVAFSDFLILSGNFGQGEVATAVVPEPSTVAVSPFACLGLLGLRKRRS